MDGAALGFGARVELAVRRYRRAILSLPGLERGAREKDLLARGPGSAEDKYTLDEHLEDLHASGALAPDQPLLAVGMRNSLVNLRAPVIRGGRVYGVDGEEPGLSRRPYYGIGARDGRLHLGQALGNASEDWRDADFFCAAVPVLDPDLSDADLLDTMLVEAADHSHLFDLPRGNHPLATDRTRADWAHLHRAFTEVRYAQRPQAIAAMRQALGALRPVPRRCSEYLHAVLGIGATGALCCLFAHGRLEDVGRAAGRLGAVRAVCVENSGSIMPTLLPEGLAGSRIPLLRAPNFRPRGRALLVIEIESGEFDTLAPMV